MESVTKLEKVLGNIVGDVLLSSAAIAYMGIFTVNTILTIYYLLYYAILYRYISLYFPSERDSIPGHVDYTSCSFGLTQEYRINL